MLLSLKKEKSAQQKSLEELNEYEKFHELIEIDSQFVSENPTVSE